MTAPTAANGHRRPHTLAYPLTARRLDHAARHTATRSETDLRVVPIATTAAADTDTDSTDTNAHRHRSRPVRSLADDSSSERR
jgi:hypothetical protein